MLKEFKPGRSGIAIIVASICIQSDSSALNISPVQLAQAAFELTKAPRSMLNVLETTLPASTFRETEWTDLMPKEDLEALLNPPDYVTNIEDGSPEDLIGSQLQNSNKNSSTDRYQQALASTKIIPELDGRAIRIPGFVVPLEFDDKQTITQFFLVPWFGACIHMPPPPPNQIILVNYPQGFELDALHTPFWISGVLKTSLVENEMAAAAYSMRMHFFEVYQEN